MRLAVVALLLWLAARAAAQSAVYVDVSGEWALAHGDRMEYARPEFDDRGWERFAIPRRGSLEPGFHWLRRTITLPAEAKAERYYLTLGTVAEKYEVWVNGQRIGSFGRMSVWDIRVARPLTFPVPDGLIGAGRPALVALRVLVSAHRPGPAWWLDTLPDTGPYALTDDVARQQTPEAEGFWRRERLALTGLLLAIVLFTLATVLLTGWQFGGERREVLWVAGYLLVAGVRGLGVWVPVAFDLPILGFEMGNGPLRPLLIVVLTALLLPRTGRLRWMLLGISTLPLWNRFLVNGHVILIGEPEVTWLPVAIDRAPWIWLVAGSAALFAAAQSVRDSAKTGRQRATWLPMAAGAAALFHLVSTWLRSFPVPGGFGGPLDQLGSVVLGFAMTLLVLDRLGLDRREKQRLADEMEAAQTVQQLLFPAEPVSGVDAVYWPAAEVGGDFWQALPLGGGGRLIVVGDVSGKGLKAAMVVALMTGALRNRKSDEPAAVLRELNEAAVSVLRGVFVTALAARVEGDRVELASAGHPSPYLGGREVDVMAGLPLGVTLEAEYASVAIRLEEGQQLTFVSDGVVEAADAKGELFGFERTRQVSGKSAAAIAEAARAWGQTDDITVVTVRRAG